MFTARELLNNLDEIVSYQNIHKKEYEKVIKGFKNRLTNFSDELEQFDYKIEKIIHDFSNIDNAEEGINYLLDIHKEHKTWRKRIVQTLNIIDNIESTSINTNRVNEIISSNDAVSERIFKEINFFEKYRIENKKSFADYVILSSKEHLISSEKLNFYDLAVYRAICTLFEHGHQLMTYKMILHSLSGSKTKTPKQSQLNDIEKSVVKMKNAMITIYLKENSYNNENNILREKLLYVQIDRNDYTINGNKSTTRVVKLLREPILFRLAKKYLKADTMSIDIIKVPISSTKANIEIKEYMIRKMARLISNSRETDDSRYKNIFFESIYNDLKANNASRKKKVREVILKILHYWIEVKYIKSFYITRKNHIYNSINIKF
ncbi:hypothetical protein [Peptostreptococcus faecalis]|uniref:hypothetical protein n=1 Tax=Peptostreptococcus faecalis TaxID=2045015 RepID=UPI000C7C1940|nr:hypothetical protein [Peptostreptococcus faecalis]